MNATSIRRTAWRLFLLLALAGVLAWGSPRPVQAGFTFTVDSTTDAVDANPGDGLCATAAGACTLRAAIQETNALTGADTISLPAGTYLLAIPGVNEDAAATGDLDVAGDLTLSGAGANVTVIDGNAAITSDRVLHVGGRVRVTISGVTIQGGSAQHGGGINNNGTLVINRSTITHNAADQDSFPFGGGIFNSGAGNLVVNNSSITGNSTLFQGGGLYIYPFSSVSINHSRITFNSTAVDGGGILNGATLNVSASLISDNTADANGGGIFNSYEGILSIDSSTVDGNRAGASGGAIYQICCGAIASVAVTNSTVSGNRAHSGGGVQMGGGALTLANSTVSGNIATVDGGGLRASDGAGVALSNVTLAFNAARYGGGLAMVDTNSVTLQDTVLALNSARRTPDCAGDITSAGYNLLGNNRGCNFTASTGDQVGTAQNPIDPLLGPLADNGGPTLTHALLEGSPAIDTGAPTDCPATDQRGHARPVDGNGDGSAICDIGSYEAAGPSPTPTPYGGPALGHSQLYQALAANQQPLPPGVLFAALTLVGLLVVAWTYQPQLDQQQRLDRET